MLLPFSQFKYCHTRRQSFIKWLMFNHWFSSAAKSMPWNQLMLKFWNHQCVASIHLWRDCYQLCQRLRDLRWWCRTSLDLLDIVPHGLSTLFSAQSSPAVHGSCCASWQTSGCAETSDQPPSVMDNDWTWVSWFHSCAASYSDCDSCDSWTSPFLWIRTI